MCSEGLREGPKSVGNEKPRRVIGAGSSEAQPEMMALLPSTLVTTSKLTSSSGAIAATIVAWPDCWGCSDR
jgi:hypothetical protein